MRFRILWLGAHFLFGLFILLVGLDRCKGLAYDETIIVSIGIAHFLLIMGLFYFHLNLLIPLFLNKQQYIRYGLGIISVTALVIGLGQLVDGVILNIQDIQWPGTFQIIPFRQMLFSHVLILLAAFPFRLAWQWQQQKKLKKKMKAQQELAELQFLKAQVNPHFLLNALNNVYSFTIMEDPVAGPTMQKLKEMMEYMLIECKQPKVLLKEEIRFLDNFLALQQVRKDGELNIKFTKIGLFNHVYIEPLLFIPFFENAFKHGNVNDTKAGILKSSLSLMGKRLVFHIENSMHPNPEIKEQGGVGLQNIQNRLQLLYPGKHQLNIKKVNNTFTVHMELALKI